MTVTPVSTAQHFIVRSLNPEILSDVYVSVEEKDEGRINPEPTELESFGYECTAHVGVDVGTGDVEVDVIYITFIMSVQYIGYLVPTVQLDNWTTEVTCTDTGT